MKRQIIESNKNALIQLSDDVTESGACSSSSKKYRLGKCEVCAAKEARYTCPKCEVKTCCLDCLQIHKKELECNGIRDRTKYIPLRQMTNMDFMSDYYFLEECVRYTQDRKRDPLKFFTHFNKSLPKFLLRLSNAANTRKTKLRFLLQNFTRRKENTTIFDWKLQKIFWRIEWIFVNSNNAKYIDTRCDEDLTLEDLLEKYVNTKSTVHVARQNLLKPYQDAKDLKVLLKAEGVKRSCTRYYSLEMHKTLKENLAHKTLVEFPEIYVLCEQHTIGFDIINSGEDVDAETKAYEAVLEEIKIKQRKAHYLAAKNAGSEEETNDVNFEGKNKPKNTLGKLQNSDEILKQTNNFLFSNERLLEALSSDDENETKEEQDVCK